MCNERTDASSVASTASTSPFGASKNTENRGGKKNPLISADMLATTRCFFRQPSDMRIID